MSIGIVLGMCSLAPGTIAWNPQAPSSQSQKPASLLAFEQARRSIVTAEITWTITYNEGRWKGHKRHLRSVLAGPDRAFFDDGPVTGFLESGKPVREPAGHLVLADAEWCLVKGEVIAEKWLRPPTPSAGSSPYVLMTDPRTIGMSPKLDTSRPVEQILWTVLGENGARSYQENSAGAIRNVVMTMNDFQVRWQLDPAKGWNASNILYSYKGKRQQEAVVSLRQFAGTWFPQAVAYYGKDDRTPHTIVEIQSATFNDPKHRRRLHPRDVGLEPGMTYSLKNGEDPAGAQPAWTGEKGVTSEEFKKLGIMQGPTVLARRATLRAKFATDAWTLITRRFIKDYKLTREQTTTAHAILKDCEAKLRAEKSITDERVSEIREKELKPRLAALLTARQRANGVHFDPAYRAEEDRD